MLPEARQRSLRRASIRSFTENGIDSDEREGGNLQFPLTKKALDKAMDIVDKMYKGDQVQSILAEIQEQRWIPVKAKIPKQARRGSLGEQESVGKQLTVIYTDLELDDVMAVAQLCQWKLDERGERVVPLIIWLVDFAEKESGKVFEMKELMAALIGVQDVFILPGEGHTENTRSWDGSVHPKTAEIVGRREETIKDICSQIEAFVSFEGDTIDLFMSAPGHGNIGAIVNQLRASTQGWPLVAQSGKIVQWNVTVYTGSFNMRGARDSDLAALEDLVSRENPLVDISRFKFFGEHEAHSSTSGLGCFCLPSLAREMMASDLLLCASIRVFHDEFNKGLIEPTNPRLFSNGVSNLSAAQQKRWQRIQKEYETSRDIKVYACTLYSDKELFVQVRSHKQGCVAAFAHDSCEAPLCDQLLFLYAWLRKTRPASLTKPLVGRWDVDTQEGRSTVEIGQEGGIQAVQPVLANCKDLSVLKEMRKVAQAYFLRHLDSLAHGRRPPEVEEPIPWQPPSTAGEMTSSCFQSLLFCESNHLAYCQITDEQGMSSDFPEAPADTDEHFLGEDESSINAWMDLAADTWERSAAGDRSPIDINDGTTLAEFDVVPPQICGVLLCEKKVRQLGDKMAFRQKRLSWSWCAGPVLVWALCLRPAQVLAGAGMAALSFTTSTCPHGKMHYPWLIWLPYLVFMAFHLWVELRIFRHLSIPYLQIVGKWQVLGIEICGHEMSFASWLCIGLTISIFHLFGLGTANVFLGMVASEKLRPELCGKVEGHYDKIWRETLNQSIVFRYVSVDFYKLPLLVLGFQFLHLAIDMVSILPGPHQWSTRGINWRYSSSSMPVRYPQPLERNVIEYIAPRVGGRSLLNSYRLHGTRFVYCNIFRNEILTGAAIDHLCQCSGMGLMGGMANHMDTVAIETDARLPNTLALANAMEFEEVLEAMKSTRKFLQDVIALLWIRILKVLFSGGFFGAQLQLQVTYFNLLCSPKEETCRGTGRLWLGIGISCVTSIFLILQTIGSTRFAMKVRRVAQRCEEFVVPLAEEKARLLDDSDDKGEHRNDGKTRQEWVQSISEKLREQGKICIRMLTALFMVFGVLIFNFTWAVAKIYMDQFGCEYHMWNVWGGCVHLSEDFNTSDIADVSTTIITG